MLFFIKEVSMERTGRNLERHKIKKGPQFWHDRTVLVRIRTTGNDTMNWMVCMEKILQQWHRYRLCWVLVISLYGTPRTQNS